MKELLLLLLIAGALISVVVYNLNSKKINSSVPIPVGSVSPIEVQKIEVDGYWYYASRTYYGYWVVGPRVPEELIPKEKVEK